VFRIDGLATRQHDVPRLAARLPGMFSQLGTRPTTFSGRQRRHQMQCGDHGGGAASYFISSIAAGSFSEMPPVSKVMPLQPARSVRHRVGYWDIP
jgi:hypothetical protein